MYTDNNYQIYDKIFKRIFALSNLSIINLINGLFETDYPLDSSVTYKNKEFVNPQLKHRFADLFITIAEENTYHLEAQMVKDNSIVIRVFEYSFYYALENRENNEVLEFPEPMVIYLSEDNQVPEKSVLRINFGTQGYFDYEIKNFIYLEHSVVELNRKKMILLIPFQLLKLRRLIQDNPSTENFLALQDLVQNDIIGSIKANMKVGNIVPDDADQLLELTSQLYQHIYERYGTVKGVKNMKPLLDGAMELPLDKYRIQVDELKQEIEAFRKEKEASMQEAEASKQEAEASKQEAESFKQEADAARQREQAALEENRRLKELIEQLKR